VSLEYLHGRFCNSVENGTFWDKMGSFWGKKGAFQEEMEGHLAIFSQFCLVFHVHDLKLVLFEYLRNMFCKSPRMGHLGQNGKFGGQNRGVWLRITRGTFLFWNQYIFLIIYSTS